MVTTVQVDGQTLELLKRLKREMAVASYAEAIRNVVAQRMSGISMAGSLKKYLKKKESARDIIKELQAERRKSDRF